MSPHSKNYFFFGLLLAVLALAVVMFLPFLASIVLAMALAVVSGPIYRWITRVFFGGRSKSNLAALVTILLVVVIILVPLFLISGKIYVEVQNMYAYLIDESGRTDTISALNSFSTSISHLFLDLYPAQSFDSFNITTIISHGLEWMFDNLSVIFNGLSRMAIGVFIMLLSLFYFLRDGAELKRQIIQLSPLGDADDEHVLRKLRQTIYAIFGGSIAIGIVQGILTGIGFAIFGVPNPAVWGSVAAVAALIPGIGTSLVLIPGIIFVFVTGSTPHAIGLLVWGLVAVGLVDNILGPLFVSKGVKVHPLLVLLSVFGGLTLFGVIGFVLGPLVLALLFALLEIYKTLTVRQG